MGEISYSLIVPHIIKNTKSFEGWYKQAWENCFQWAYFEQGAVFRNVRPNLLALEMTTVWLSWYNGGNQRDAISNIHNHYSESILNERVASSIENEIWSLLSNLYARAYSTYLDKIYDLPEKHTMIPSTSEYNRFIGVVAQTFKPNPEYDFVGNSGVMIRAYDDYDLLINI
jgi:hypothetical protein